MTCRYCLLHCLAVLVWHRTVHFSSRSSQLKPNESRTTHHGEEDEQVLVPSRVDQVAQRVAGTEHHPAGGHRVTLHPACDRVHEQHVQTALLHIVHVIGPDVLPFLDYRVPPGLKGGGGVQSLSGTRHCCGIRAIRWGFLHFTAIAWENL